MKNCSLGTFPSTGMFERLSSLYTSTFNLQMQFPMLFFMVNNWELIEKRGHAALKTERAEPNGASEEMVLHTHFQWWFY